MRSGAPRFDTRARVGLVIVLLFAFLSAVQLTRKAVGTFRAIGRPDEVTVGEARFTAVRSFLTARARVGYMGRPGREQAGDAAYDRRFCIAQYAVAPIQLADRIDMMLVLGDFETPPDPAELERLQLSVVQDFGAGVMLLGPRSR